MDLGFACAILLKDGEDWRIDGLEFGSPKVPNGTQLVKVQASEFAFSLQEEPDGGNVAFEVENVGDQQHHVVIEKIPEDLDIEAAVQSDDEPEGVVQIG